MPQYLFILGRNPQLLVEEIKSYLKKEGNNVINYKLSNNGLLVDIDNKLHDKTIDNLGGTIAIGEVLCDVNEKEFDKINIYNGTKNKLNYVIWNFSKDNSYNKASEYLKKRFKQEQIKAAEKNLNGSLELQDGTSVRIASGLIDEEYFVFDDYFGKVIERCNYKEIEERDMNKPVRREQLSISPRLAKIMINLSEAKKGEKLLDPFCGVGIILMEALMQGINVIGVDNDKNAIQGAIKNLGWGGFSKDNYQLICGDSKKIMVQKSNVIVTEPDFGQILRQVPSKEITANMMREYENLIISVLKNLKDSVSGRIVFTAPLIKTGKIRVSCNMQRILQETKLKLAKGFPIQEYRQSQIVGREVWVLEK